MRRPEDFWRPYASRPEFAEPRQDPSSTQRRLTRNAVTFRLRTWTSKNSARLKAGFSLTRSGSTSRSRWEDLTPCRAPNCISLAILLDWVLKYLAG